MSLEDRKVKASVPAAAGVPTRRKSKSKMIKKVVTLVVVLALAAGTGFFYYKYHQANNKAKLLANPQAAAAQQVTDLVDQVGKLVVLPNGEKPTVATVSDITKLKGQAFFASAQNGDKVLIYTQAKKAVLFRPSDNKVIEIAPLNIGTSSASSSTTPSTTTDSTTAAADAASQ